jgi:hypothetical protein
VPIDFDHARADALGDLRRRPADTPSRADDRQRLIRPQLRRFHEAPPGCHIIDHDRRGLVEREPRGLAPEARDRHGDLLRMRAVAGKPDIAARTPNLCADPFAGLAITTPAKSRPGMRGKVVWLMAPCTFFTSLGLIEAASIRTTAVSDPSTGSGTSTIRN